MTGELFPCRRAPRPRRNPMWEQVQGEWCFPWAEKHGRDYPVSSVGKLIGQWRRVCVLEPDATIRRLIVTLYLACPDRFVCERDHDLGLLLARWHSLQARARHLVARETREQRLRSIPQPTPTAPRVAPSRLAALAARAERRRAVAG